MRSDNPSWFSWPFARLWNRVSPNADRQVMIVGPDLSQPQPSNIDVAIAPRGSGAIIAGVPDGTAAGGDKRGTNAVDLQTSRAAASSVASGTQSVVGGGTGNTASGNQSVVAGGNNNTASGVQSSVVTGTTNTASGQWSVVCSGTNCNASAQGAFIGTGSFLTASAGYAGVVSGANNVASGGGSFVGGGGENTASGSYATIPGGFQATTRSLYARMSYSSGMFAAAGDAQWGLHVLRRQTTDATLTVLTADANAPGAANIPVLPNTSLYGFRIRVTCIQSAGSAGTVGDCKAWDVVGSIKRGAAAANTALLGTPTITVLGADTNLGADNVTGAIISITADTTRGGINVNVTGEVNKTLRWVASVETTEVDY